MSTTAHETTLKALVDGVLSELMPKTTGDQVYLDETTTLSAKLTELIAALNNKATKEDIANLINSAPETMDTFGEIAALISENDEAMDLLNQAIGLKASKDELNTHANNKNNPHGVTKAQVGLGNVDNTADKDKNVNSAVKDGSGRIIADTYATKDEVSGATEMVAGSMIYISATQPENMTSKDLWFHITN